MTHHITDEQIAQAVARGWCHPSNSGKEMDADLARAISDEVRAVLALAAPQGEPYGWAVTGCHSLYRGEWAESTAQAEAKRCGGTAVAFPLYTAAPSVQPEQAEAVEPVAYRIDYPGVTDIIGLRRFCGADEYQSFRPTIEFLGGVFVPLYTQSPTAVPEDVRMQAKMYRWLRDCAPADWLSRVCNVFSKRGAAFDEEVRAAMSAENGGV